MSMEESISLEETNKIRISLGLKPLTDDKAPADSQEETAKENYKKQRERERMQQALEPPVFLDKGKNPQCGECGSIDVDQTFRKVFGCLVCKKCQNEKPEKYSLLTKTECKEVSCRSAKTADKY